MSVAKSATKVLAKAAPLIKQFAVYRWVPTANSRILTLPLLNHVYKHMMFYFYNTKGKYLNSLIKVLFVS